MSTYPRKPHKNVQTHQTFIVDGDLSARLFAGNNIESVSKENVLSWDIYLDFEAESLVGTWALDPGDGKLHSRMCKPVINRELGGLILRLP